MSVGIGANYSNNSLVLKHWSFQTYIVSNSARLLINVFQLRGMEIVGHCEHNTTRSIVWITSCLWQVFENEGEEIGFSKSIYVYIYHYMLCILLIVTCNLANTLFIFCNEAIKASRCGMRMPAS